MIETRILLLGIVNFGLLIGLFAWLFRPLAKQFFYARRTRIRKQMINSVWELRKARSRVAESRHQFDDVHDDIRKRVDAIGASCDEECKSLVAEARRKESHFMKGASRRAEEDRIRFAAQVRSRLLNDAFRRAEEKLKKGFSADQRRRLINQGLEALSGRAAQEEGA